MGGLLHSVEDGRVRPHIELVRKLVDNSVPNSLSRLELREVASQGWDNTTFRLGDTYSVRLPTAQRYEAQLEREIPFLSEYSSAFALDVPTNVRAYTSTHDFPYRWSTRKWVPGKPLMHFDESNVRRLAQFLHQLWDLPAPVHGTGRYLPSVENFWRGSGLDRIEPSFREACRLLPDFVSRPAGNLWDLAKSTQFDSEASFVHGDLSSYNLVASGRRLTGVIDWGLLAYGDPACDLAIAWREFDADIREAFFDRLVPSADLRMRGKLWAVWKLSLLSVGLAKEAASDPTVALERLAEILGVQSPLTPLPLTR